MDRPSKWGPDIPQALLDLIEEQVSEIMLITFGRLGLSDKWVNSLVFPEGLRK
jgi:hypothetical protein